MERGSSTLGADADMTLHEVTSVWNERKFRSFVSPYRVILWRPFWLLSLPLRERTVPIDAANPFLCSRVMGEALGACGSS